MSLHCYCNTISLYHSSFVMEVIWIRKTNEFIWLVFTSNLHVSAAFNDQVYDTMSNVLRSSLVLSLIIKTIIYVIYHDEGVYVCTGGSTSIECHSSPWATVPVLTWKMPLFLDTTGTSKYGDNTFSDTEKKLLVKRSQFPVVSYVFWWTLNLPNLYLWRSEATERRTTWHSNNNQRNGTIESVRVLDMMMCH